MSILNTLVRAAQDSPLDIVGLAIFIGHNVGHSGTIDEDLAGVAEVDLDDFAQAGIFPDGGADFLCNGFKIGHGRLLCLLKRGDLKVKFRSRQATP